MTTFDNGGVNTAWLGGVEFLGGYSPFMECLDKRLVWCTSYLIAFNCM